MKQKVALYSKLRENQRKATASALMESWDHSFFSHIRTIFKDPFGIAISISAILKILF
jgi:hypothetical protein